MPDSTPPSSSSAIRRRWWPVVLLVVFVLLGIAARASLHFRSPLVPGINGGYYLVQARAVLEHGWLGIPDLPLTFCLHATVAKIIHLLRGGNLEDCIVLAVKSLDSLLPPLAAVPVFVLGMAWSRRLGRGAWLVPVVAALLAVGMPGLSITGEFEKNALGLVWLAALIWSLHEWLEHADKRHALRVLLFLGLVGVTHIGVFGASLLFTGLTLAVSLVQHPALLRRRSTWIVLGSALVVIGAAVGIVAWKFDPTRIARLWQAVSDPTEFLQGGGPGGPPGGMMRPGGGIPGGAPARGMGGPPGMMREWEPTAFFAMLSLPALVVAWWKRKSWDKGTIAVVTGAALTVVVMTGPWVGGDKMNRFPLIAIVPAVVTALFALLHAPRVWLSAPLTLALTASLVVPSVRLVRGGSGANITEDAFAELREIATSVEEPDKTIVIARHGLEWWTAWTLHTHIAQSRAMKPEDWTHYKYVWMINEHSGGGGGMRGGPWRFSFADVLGRSPRGPGGPPGMGGPRGPMPGGMPPGDAFPQNPPFAPPNPLALVDPLVPLAAMPFPVPGGGPGNGPRGGGGGPFVSESIPSDAEILHEGRHFTLAWLRDPPRYVAERREEKRPR